AAMELSTVSGQKPVITKAKKSIAAFKLRTGMPVGVAVTLRGDRLLGFCDYRLLAADG
ncbi:MAG: 50S ribosomal protein L5, partial [Acidobacteria bacterium]